MAKGAIGYRCSECGWQTPRWAGRCGECQAWGTLAESSARGSSLGSGLRPVPALAPLGERVAVPITQIGAEVMRHRPTGIAEFDRVLGGGLVPGAAILLSGEPGVGKSTLLLDVAARAAREGLSVLYLSAEESAGQVRIRAERTGALHERLLLASETDLGAVLGHIDASRPELLIVDSVQTVASSAVEGFAGGPSQVREVAATLIRVAKERALPTILVGHVTKDGQIAGPRLLEHLVDVVCQFEGDPHTALRFVRALKNRYGPTDEVGCFEMTGDGIAEVSDPSGLFLSARGDPVSGTCVTIAMEGRRALPVEVQALIVSSTAPNPRRVTNGLDASRVAMLTAVLERRAGLRIAERDIYVSTVGGVRLTEPAADLAIALAIASAARDQPLPRAIAAVGEISLAGEIRPVLGGAHRGTEAARLGYATVLDSRAGSLRDALAHAFSASGTPSPREAG